MKLLKTLFLVLMLSLFVGGQAMVLTGCEDENGIEEVGEDTEDTFEDAGDEMEEGVEETDDEMEEAVE